MDQFLKALPPSYLHFDYQGRVIRLDVGFFTSYRADRRRFPKRLPQVRASGGSHATRSLQNACCAARNHRPRRLADLVQY